MNNLDAPDGWAAPALNDMATAKAHALAGLQSPRLAEFYTSTRNYAGITFASLQPNEDSTSGRQIFTPCPCLR